MATIHASDQDAFHAYIQQLEAKKQAAVGPICDACATGFHSDPATARGCSCACHR